jgi:HPt (histidine-containing phosphotransfer) domain-containing protein
VALTANAVAGQAEVFLNNGFDDFLSKPIDIRQLNMALNKWVRDRQKADVVEAARRQAAVMSGDFEPEPDGEHPAIDPHTAEVFSRDARKALAVIEDFIGKGGMHEEADLKMYVISVHGLRSALANIGRAELSAVAGKLEQLGRAGIFKDILPETKEFIGPLRSLLFELMPADAGAADAAMTEDELSNLREKLLVIKAACEEYDENTAESTLDELRKVASQRALKEFLGSISELLLHCDFEEIVDAVDKYLMKGDA